MADLDLRDIMQEEDELPKLTRGRSSEDYDVLIEAMKDGKPHSLQDVSEDDRAKLGQKIRGAASRAGFKVTVRYSKPNSKLYFQKTGETKASEPETSPAEEETATQTGRGRKAS